MIVTESERSVELAPDDAFGRAVLAMTRVAQNRLTPALAEARRATELDPKSARAWVSLCVVERLRGRLTEAETACRRAADLEPDAPRVLLALGEVLRERGATRDAMELFGQATDLDYESILPQLAGAGTLTRAGNLVGASRAWGIILDKYPEGRTRATQGAAAAALAAGESDAALAFYDQVALPENASLPTLLTLYGKGYALLRLDRAAEAEYFLTLLVERVPQDYDGPARGREVLFLAYDELVRYFDERGRTERALEVLRDAAARPFAPTRMARRLAERLAARGRADEGTALLSRAFSGADPLEDPLETSDSALALARLGSGGGKRALRSDSDAGRAMTIVEERLQAGAPGAAQYRMARAWALARDPEASLRALGRARDGGYLPAAQAATEPDFAVLRDDPVFRRLLQEAGARASD